MLMHNSMNGSLCILQPGQNRKTPDQISSGVIFRNDRLLLHSVYWFSFFPLFLSHKRDVDVPVPSTTAFGCGPATNDCSVLRNLRHDVVSPKIILISTGKTAGTRLRNGWIELIWRVPRYSMRWPDFRVVHRLRR